MLRSIFGGPSENIQATLENKIQRNEGHFEKINQLLFKLRFIQKCENCTNKVDYINNVLEGISRVITSLLIH